jgi:leader peptidase (prepilin peptidase)/N-methyltransferase
MPLLYWFIYALLVGAAIGSFINVCVDRLPYEKSLFWPGSRCPVCLQPVRWYDNIPILSYLLLAGRCRTCKAPMPLRALAVEIGTPLAFALILYLEASHNTLRLPLFNRVNPATPALAIPLHHMILFAFLLTASLCDLDRLDIPITITIPGTIVGLVLSTLWPWPWPSVLPAVPPAGLPPLLPPTGGVHAWPVWYPLPSWLPPNSWQLGLATGLAGAVAGTVILRGVAFLFKIGRGIEGLGIGDADLMMMVGAFVGWQPVVVAFFVAVVPGLVIALLTLATKGEHPMPFGPSLALGSMITILFWPNIGPPLSLFFFDTTVLGLLVGAGAFILLFTSFILRLRGVPNE